MGRGTEFFTPNVSGDNSLYNNRNSFQKISLDNVSDSLQRESLRIWFPYQEDELVKHIKMVAKNKRFFEWRRRPFVWAPCEFVKEIRQDRTMRIPESIEQFLELKAEGRYDFTSISTINFKGTSIKLRDQTFAWTPVDSANKNADTEDLIRKFYEFFCGVPYDEIEHENDKEKTFENMFDKSVIAEIRESLRIAVVKLESILPSM